MNTDAITAGIRMMIDSAIVQHTTSDPEKQRIAGELYSENETVVREGLQKLANLVNEHRRKAHGVDC